MSSKHIILQKLDDFIRKYYRNELLKGLIYVVAGVLSAFLIVSTFEYFGNFDEKIRTILFFSFLGLSIFILVKYFFIPLAHLFNMGKTINYSDASKIVGKHFPDIKDKLLNTIQLDLNNSSQNELLEAAIQQRTTQLQPVPFQKAVDFKSNLKYLKYAIIPVIAFAIVMLISPGFTNSTKRIVQYNKHFEKEAPFQFNLLNNELEILQNTDFVIEVETKGSVKPNEVWVDVDGNAFKMKNEVGTKFTYSLRNVNSSKVFQFKSDEVNSGEFNLSVIPKASLMNLTAKISYPKYTGLKNETLDNPGDITVPEGTLVDWKFKTKNTSKLQLKFLELVANAKKTNNGFSFKKVFRKNDRVTITPKNDQAKTTDSISYQIQVVQDEFPVIKINEEEDSAVSKKKYITGELEDDYGLNRLTFNYKIIKKDNSETEIKSEPIEISKSNSERFFYYWDLNTIELSPSDKIEYYFEVWDNDGVNGSKSSKSHIQVIDIPSEDEIDSKTEQANQEIKKDISDSKKSLKKMSEQLEDIQQKLTEKKSLDWEEKQKIKELLDKHKNLEKQLENIIDKNQDKNEQESEFKDIDQQILDKQKELEDLFEKVMDDEMKELMKKIEDLMEKNKKDELNEALEKMKMEDQDVEKQLDRMIEQLKRLEVEKDVYKNIDKLNKLSEEQKKLSKETEKQDKKKGEEAEKKQEELQKKQDKLNKKFDQLKKDLDKTMQKNKDLKSPMNLDMNKPKQQEISQDQKESSENLQKKKNNKASKKQDDAAKKMQEMAEKMEQNMQEAQQQQNQEDYNTLREILENLILVSKDQERVMNEFKSTRGYSPKYVDLGQQQRKIKDDTKIIEDSLFALSKRSLQVKHFINEEIAKVNSNIGKSIKEVGERRTRRVVNHQQLTMTSMNNLALMLSESLKQMQEQMKSQKKSNSSCNKPGQKNPNPNSMKSLKQMQQQLQKQLKEMQEGMKKGQKPGSKQFGEAAAKQAAIRKKLKDIQKRLDKEGKGKKLGNLNKTQELMDDLEKDLYNKRLSPAQLQKHQQILIRLLEHEKAQEEQEQEQKRKSNEGKEIKRELPPSIEKYLKEKQKEEELLRTLPPDLSPYYKKKVREYFKNLSD